MSTAANKDLARRLVGEAVEGRLEVVDELCSPEVVHHTGGPATATGPESVKDALRSFGDSLADGTWEEHRVVAEGDVVVVHGTRSGTWKGMRHRGVHTRTSKRVSVEQFFVLRIAGGAVVEVWIVADDLAMLQELGAIY